MGGRKVYGSLDSAGTLKVLALLFELDLEFEFVPVDVDAGQNLEEPFLSMSPFGELPVYEDGPFRLSEYGAILRCVAHKHSKKGEELICWDGKDQAAVANWVDVEDSHCRPAATKLLNELNEEAETKMVKVLDVYESQLSNNNKYLVMGKYTIVDVAHLPHLHSLMDRPETRKLIAARPCVNAWVARILARPAWTKVLQMHTVSA